MIDRLASLRALIALQGPVPQLLTDAHTYDLEPGALVDLTLADVRRALALYASKDVSARELEDWAEAIHTAEDIELDETHRAELAQILFELSTPALFGGMAEAVESIGWRLSPELRFFDAIVRAVMLEGEEWSTRIINAAVDALVDGLDSPSLAELAGQSADDDQAATERLLVAACEERGIPYPPRREHWEPREIDGRRWARIARDSIRFSVEPSEDTLNDFELYIFVNEVDVTLGLGAGLAPITAFWPSNPFDVSDQPRRVPIAMCPGCGDIGCDSTWVDIRRDGEAVHWDWVDFIPYGTDAGASFSAADYDAEVARIRVDRSWERPQDTVARLVYESVDLELLRQRGLRLSWVAELYTDPTKISVSLSSPHSRGEAEHPFQVFLRFPWNQVDAEPVARAILRTLAQSPELWRATYSMNRPDDATYVPPIAGAGWRRRGSADVPPETGTEEAVSAAKTEEAVSAAETEERWAPWLSAYVFNPSSRDATLREIENVEIRADNAKIIARTVATTAIVALGAGILLGVVALSNQMEDSSGWMRLLLLTFGLLAILGLGLSVWREGGRHVEGVEVTRARAMDALENDRTKMLPRSIFRELYVSSRASDEDVWSAAQQLHALNEAWVEYAELSGSPNLTLWQEIQILDAEESARAVLDAVGELLNPGSTTS
ncbi:hypothetical protein [Microbacterium sp. NPDC087665]|uniref:hypothetical protein n=1 Tax=Microbacterium sp. NPDC087665 TaxID=3364194 RepID=UPI00381A488C